MVTLPPWLVGIVAIYIVSISAVFAYLFVDTWKSRPPRWSKRADPVEQAYADAVGFALAVEPAPATDELPVVYAAEVDGLVVEIYRHQIRAHFKSIYGEDGQA